MAGYSSLASTCGKPFYSWRTLTYHAQYGSKLSVLTNETEGKRTRQIQRMAEVYRRAQRVWIWLGEAHHCTLRAIIEMQRLVRALSSNNTSRSFQCDYDHYFDESDRPREKWIVWEGDCGLDSPTLLRTVMGSSGSRPSKGKDIPLWPTSFPVGRFSTIDQSS
jgi:hypothetical protein